MALRCASMPSVQIKNVPEDVHRVLRRRAAEAGQSLQEYLLAQLTDMARHPTVEEVFARIEERDGADITLGFAVEAIRAERDARS